MKIYSKKIWKIIFITLLKLFYELIFFLKVLKVYWFSAFAALVIVIYIFKNTLVALLMKLCSNKKKINPTSTEDLKQIND